MEVFISHAPADRSHRTRLEVHLGLMVRQKLIRTWHRAHVEPGEEPSRETAAHLDAARMVLLLVSAHFLAQDDCYEEEMMRALERHDAGEARVVAILVHECDWQSAPFARLDPLPTGGKPVSSWRNRHEAWAAVARGVRTAAEQLRELDERRMRDRALSWIPGGFVPPPQGLPGLGAPPSQAAQCPPPGGLGAPPSQAAQRLPPGGLGAPPSQAAQCPPFGRVGGSEMGVPGAAGVGTKPAPGPRERAPAIPAPEPVDDSTSLDREEELVLLLDRLAQGPVLIWSPDPVGNASLAHHLAQELAPHYGPEVHVDLRGAARWKPSWKTAMRSVIECLNQRSRVHPPHLDNEALRDRYRAAIAIHSPILIFTNARKASQIEPLLPSTGHIVLITSERPIHLASVYTRQVDPLALLGEAEPQGAAG
ncbi:MULTISPECIES: toll/interleukin-1 receptor domain-containing protein [Sorangium]|uniref:toll/interleukin-1 receptor domain-containing protein n=1 Tax=Sorangium TaxID=39643 RepID=UPI001A923B56|nr:MULTISPECIES: toll/interleukin-1 receptor domain-containing protein [Sorangium]